MNNFFRKFAAAAALSALCAASAVAAPITFNISWSGAAYQNGASGTGVITLDDSIVLNNTFANTSDPLVGSLDITISGATSGNGSYSASDFNNFYFLGVAQLDLTQELIGQTMDNGCLFGTSTGICGNGQGGDFNVFGGWPAPNGVYYFDLAVASGERMLVTSIIQASDVPEPASITLFGLAAAGLALARRRKQSV